MRIYNGCPDAEAQAWLDDKSKAVAKLVRAGFQVSYFPMEQKWMAFKDYLPASAMHDTIHQVVKELLK